MRRTIWLALSVAGLVAGRPAGVAPAGGAEIKPAADAPQPHSPQESQKLFAVPEGFRVELVASEPHLADPTAMAFDAQGRILVCELHGYNLEGYLDVMELNKTGVLDTAVRRIPANPDAIERAKQDQYGTVKLLEDTDGDGRVDRASVLADRLPPCYGVVPARDGVIVLCAPDIVYLADRDGDGKAEVRQTLFTGFGVGELWTRINNPRWGLDNWIYGVSGGGSGGTIRGPALPNDVTIGSVCFRFKADGSRFEPCSGATYGYGQAVNNRADETLLTDVLDPSSRITVGYRNYTVLSDDGQIFTGVLAEETATSVTLRREEGDEDTILRRNIDEMEATRISMMPAEVEKEVNPQQVADLIAYLRQALGPLPPPQVTLFEDKASFADMLGEGGGTARITTDDCFSGRAALAVTPPQRFSPRIPGWQYRIAENPGPGEFRYLRFAWKSRGGQGVMIELAADGHWPAADSNSRRYYSGKNTTGWEAVEVSAEAPKQWDVVTRDLWRDFGTFTLTGVAPTVIGGEALFDHVQLLRSLDDLAAAP